MTDRLFLDELHVGQRFTSKSHVVDADQIKRFAVEFDPQPFHLDEDAAANSLFAGLAASGWHTGCADYAAARHGRHAHRRWHRWRRGRDRLSETDAAR